MRIIFKITLSLLFAFSSTLALEQKRIIKMGYIDFYPIFYTKENGKAAGTYIELMNEVSKEANIDIEYYLFPPSRLANQLISGKIDLWVGLSTLPNFAENTIHSKTIISKIELKLYWLNLSYNFTHANYLQEIKDKNLVVLRGYSYGGLLNTLQNKENKYKFSISDSHQAAIDFLQKGRADVLLNYHEPMQVVLKQNPSLNLKEMTIDSYPAHLVVSKKIEKPKELLQDLEKALIKVLSLKNR